jgi:integrase
MPMHDALPATSPTRGDGMIYKKRTRDPKTGAIREAKFFTMQLYLPALRRHRKRSTGTADEALARKRLARWHAEVLGGSYLPDADRTTFDQLAAMLLDDYRANRRRSLPRLEHALAHLAPVFGGARARAITRDRVVAYTRQRREQDGAAAATVNRELAALKRIFRLGEISSKVGRRPHIPMLDERNVRQGFFERPAFEAILRHLPEDLQSVVTVAYLTGWRLASELLTRQWRHVDFTAGWLRLDPGETKNGEGRMFPLTAELRAVLEAQRERTRTIERETGQIVPWLFHRNGQPIRSLARAWRTAVRKAGVPGRLVHDFRRTAVRNLERAGVPRSTAMKMVGHKTEAIYRRYAIVDEQMLREGADKLDRQRQQAMR